MSEKSVTAQHHALAIPGTWNFRDLGGTPTPDGAIRPGIVFRSAALAQLDDRGLRALETLRITEVFDLRGHREIARDGPDRVPASVTVRIAPFHPEEGEALAHEVQDEAESDGQPWTGGERLRAYYAAIPTLAPARESVAALLRTVADGGFDRGVDRGVDRGGGVLVHCAAGKDRTGWAIATLLTAVGVDRDAVLADYLQSNTAVESLRTWMLDRYGDEALRTDDQILGVDESYLQAAWDAADAAFGSFEGYLDSIGIDDGVVRRLRVRLLG